MLDEQDRTLLLSALGGHSAVTHALIRIAEIKNMKQLIGDADERIGNLV